MLKKGQTAMEYLMTYGWAILVVIIVVAALYAMGIFKLPGGGPPCSPCFPAGSDIAYMDHSADTLVVRVGARSISNIVVHDPAGSTCTEAGPFDPGSTATISCPGVIDLRGDAPIYVEYTVVDTGVTHNVTATLHGAA